VSEKCVIKSFKFVTYNTVRSTYDTSYCKNECKSNKNIYFYL